MSPLPDWLLRIKKTLPQWIERVRHPAGPGKFRFALEAYEPCDLDSSALLHNAIYATAGREQKPPGAEERRQWIDYLAGLQRPEDGLLIDPGLERHIAGRAAAPTAQEIFNVRRWTSRNGLCVISQLGGRPRYPLSHAEACRAPAEMVAALEKLDWHNPWDAGSRAGALVLFQHFNHLTGDEKAEDIMRAAVAWLLEKQDPQTGAWSAGGAIPLHVLINGIFKVWIQVMPAAAMPVQYPAAVIDLCLKGLREDPALRDTPDACSIFDVALVLDIALRFSDHRRAEAAELAAAALPRLEAMARPDGAFSYHAGHSLANHGGLELAPVKDQSDAAGTALICNTIALLGNLCGWRAALGWTPLTEWRLGLKEN